jgi:hypothetical protein
MRLSQEVRHLEDKPTGSTSLQPAVGTGAKLTLAGVAQAFHEACSALSVKV